MVDIVNLINTILDTTLHIWVENSMLGHPRRNWRSSVHLSPEYFKGIWLRGQDIDVVPK
jgi:hypothetical protein